MNCMLIAYSKATGFSIETLIEMLGHDGEEILYQFEHPPYNKRGFYTSEFNSILYPLGYRFTELIVGHIANDKIQEHCKLNNYIAYTKTHCEYFEKGTIDLLGIKGIILVDYKHY